VDVRPITFLSDFGRDDVFVGLCHAAVAAIAPEARVIDLTHGVPAHDVLAGARALEDCVPYVDAAVHLAVVDPGVGSHREGVVLAAGDALLVGPNNGLLLPAARRLGGVTAGYRLTEPRYRRPQVSRTFHGRDVFAPAAAHLALGADPASFGDPVDIAALTDLPLPVPQGEDAGVVANVRGVDRFGNVQIRATTDDLARAGLTHDQQLRLMTAHRHVEIEWVGTYGDLASGRVGLIEDSFGWLAVVRNRGHAAGDLQLSVGDTVRVAAGPHVGGHGAG
jgi:hypothetical protein